MLNLFQSCANDMSGKQSSKEGAPVEGATAAEVEESEVTVWMCLQCGHQVRTRNICLAKIGI